MRASLLSLLLFASIGSILGQRHFNYPKPFASANTDNDASFESNQFATIPDKDEDPVSVTEANPAAVDSFDDTELSPEDK